MSPLLSRHAESMFWMARYFERAESLARVLETQTSFHRGRGADNSWAWIIALYADEAGFSKAYGDPTAANVIEYYVTHIDNPGSILSSLRAARENARALRHMLSTDMWHQLNDFYNRMLAFGPSDFSEVRLSRTCDAIKRGCYAQIGVAENTLYHDECWPFFRLGINVERADQISRLLDVRFAQQQTGFATDEGQLDFTFWTILLRAASAYHAYRRAFRHTAPAEMARFLIFDPRLPRSLLACLGEISNMLEMLRRNFGLVRAGGAPAEELDKLLTGLEAASRDDHLLPHLHAFNDWVQRSLIALTNALGQTFFSHPDTSQQAPAPVISQSQSQTGQSQTMTFSA